MSSGFFSGPIPPWGYVAGALLGIGLVLIGAWYGYGRGERAADAEEERLLRAQAKARRTHPVHRQAVDPEPYWSPELTHEWDEWPEAQRQKDIAWLAHEEQGFGLVDDRGQPFRPPWADKTVLNPTAVLTPDQECAICHDTYVNLREHLAANLKGCAGEESTTAWTRRMAADMDAFLKGLIGGTDEQLREITR